jgi:hypothetical protein
MARVEPTVALRRSVDRFPSYLYRDVLHHEQERALARDARHQVPRSTLWSYAGARVRSANADLIVETGIDGRLGSMRAEY